MAPTNVVILLALASLVGLAAAESSYQAIYGTVTCYADAVIQPRSTEELAAAIRAAAVTAAMTGRTLKIRATRSKFHSIASFPCAHKSTLLAAPSTSKVAPTTIAVLQDDFDKVLFVNRMDHQIRVQAGMRCDQVVEWAEKNGMATPIGGVTNYAELTLGGVISASGHGTGANVINSPADITTELTWVDALGNIRVSARNSPEGRALVGGVGTLGIITEVNLQLNPKTRTKAISVPTQKDPTMVVDILKFIKKYPNMLVNWRPDLGMYNLFLLELTKDPPTKGIDDVSSMVFPYPRALSNSLQLALLPWQADVNETAVTATVDPLMCLTGATTMLFLKWSAKGVPPLAIPQVLGVGSTNRIVTGGCEPNCVWNSELTTDDMEITIELEDLPAWVEDVKRVIKMDLQDGGLSPKKCMSIGYFLLRFGNGNTDASSTTSGMKQPVYVEVTTTRTRKLPHVPGKYSWIQDILEQRTLCKYKGRPHWGKNFDRTFTHPTCHLRDSYPHFNHLVEMQTKYDPEGVFESPLMRRVIHKKGPVIGPGCSVTRQCYCSRDRHCAKGWVCVPSMAFPDIKTCKPAGKKGVKH